MSIDVVMIVRNGNKLLGKCLDSLYANVPVNRLIVVDGGSTDGTLDTVRRYPHVMIVQDGGKTRATARQRGIESVETGWFMFLDSDVILSPNWYAKLRPYMSLPNVGAVQGSYDSRPQYDDEIQILNVKDRIIKKSRVSLGPRAWRVPLDRMDLPVLKGDSFTGDTLIRREAVAGIKIPSFLHVYEDRYIRWYIESRGYRWIVPREKMCVHYCHRKNLDAYYLSLIDSSLEYGGPTESLSHLLKYMVNCLPGVLTRPKTALRGFMLLLWNLTGSLKAWSVKSAFDKAFLDEIVAY